MPVKLTVRPPDTKYVAKVIIFNEDGEVLLLKRKKNQKYPEKWDLPGGHLIQGEEWISGAKREVKEETNLSIKDLKKVSSEGRKTFYKTSTFEGDIFDSDKLPEHDEYMWINVEKVDELKHIGDIYVEAIKGAVA